MLSPFGKPLVYMEALLYIGILPSQKEGMFQKMKWQPLMFLHYFNISNLALILSFKTC